MKLRIAIIVAVAVTVACMPLSSGQSVEPTTIAAVGDIACPGAFKITKPNNCRHMDVANLIAAGNPDYFMPLGDIQYPDGANYTQYNLAFGRFNTIDLPVVGNHEYNRANGAPFYTYFGAQTWPVKTDVGNGWRVVTLDANCGKILQGNSCTKQTANLKAYLATLPLNPCVIAAWHQPRWTGGQHAGAANTQKYWETVASRLVPLVLNGHNHRYERTDPLDALGNPVVVGTTEIISGGGGHSLDYPAPSIPQDAEIFDGEFGYLSLQLTPGVWTSSWMNIQGESKDAATGTCTPVGV